MMRQALLVLLVQLQLDIGFSLLLKRVRVPGLVWSGRDAPLHCDYDTQGEDIYSVKWYKGGQEVFRWLPSQPDQPITIYPRPGVRIDQNKSSATSMALQAVDLSSTGRYRCEVSTEAPMFSTASGFGDLLVVSAPPGPPLIQGDIRENYQPGDLVHLNCSSRDSKPAADLSWKINGQTADSSYIIPHPVITSPSGLLTSTSEIILTLGKRHFTPDGRIRIECEARIGRSSPQSSTVRSLTSQNPTSTISTTGSQLPTQKQGEAESETSSTQSKRAVETSSVPTATIIAAGLTRGNISASVTAQQDLRSSIDPVETSSQSALKRKEKSLDAFPLSEENRTKTLL